MQNTYGQVTNEHSSPESQKEELLKSSLQAGSKQSVSEQIALKAQELLDHQHENREVDKNVRCALQASNILIDAGVLDPRDATNYFIKQKGSVKAAVTQNGEFYRVDEMVYFLLEQGWKLSITPKPGAVAFSHKLSSVINNVKEFGDIREPMDARSHIGVVGPDNKYVYHNSGPDEGKVIRTPFSGEKGYNADWVKGVTFLIAPEGNPSIKESNYES